MLSLKDVYDHFGDQFSRSFFEGSEIVRNGFVIECLIKKKEIDMVEIFALCLQSSDPSACPHEVTVMLKEKSSEEMQGETGKSYKIQNAQCTCKAGSHKCEHTSAVLIKLERTAEETLECFSETDLLLFGKYATLQDRAKNLYNPIPVKHFPCIANKKRNNPANCDDSDAMPDFDHGNNLKEFTQEEAFKILMERIRN